MNAHNRLASSRDLEYCYQPPPLPTDAIKLAALSAQFPEFAFFVTFVTFVRSRRCYQAERIRGEGTVLSVASASTIELWRILRRACR
jgi:hypothetical protein